MSETDDRLIVLPVKIRDGVLARLDLPAKLTPAEADRLAAIIRAWATDDIWIRRPRAEESNHYEHSD